MVHAYTGDDSFPTFLFSSSDHPGPVSHPSPSPTTSPCVQTSSFHVDGRPARHRGLRDRLCRRRRPRERLVPGLRRDRDTADFQKANYAAYYDDFSISAALRAGRPRLRSGSSAATPVVPRPPLTDPPPDVEARRREGCDPSFKPRGLDPRHSPSSGRNRVEPRAPGGAAHVHVEPNGPPTATQNVNLERPAPRGGVRLAARTGWRRRSCSARSRSRASATPGHGTLRDAIASANDGDKIAFFSAALDHGTILLTSGEIDFSTSLDIEGPGAGLLTISGDGRSVGSSAATGADADVTIAGPVPDGRPRRRRRGDPRRRRRGQSPQPDLHQ